MWGVFCVYVVYECVHEGVCVCVCVCVRACLRRVREGGRVSMGVYERDIQREKEKIWRERGTKDRQIKVLSQS